MYNWPPIKYPIVPLHLTSLHFPSLHFSSLHIYMIFATLLFYLFHAAYDYYPKPVSDNLTFKTESPNASAGSWFQFLMLYF